jgi:hypothetical protein
MKTLFLSLKMFFKKPILNIFLILELMLVSCAFVIVINIIDYSNNYLNTLQESKYRFLYCSSFGLDEGTSYAEQLESKYSSFSYFVGVLKNEYQPAFLNSDKKIKAFQNIIVKSENNEEITDAEYKAVACEPKDFADVYYFDNATIEAFKYPLSSGKWIQKTTDSNAIPCVVGGKYSKKYNIGDTINAYVLDKSRNIIEIKYYISGILANPQYLISTSHAGINHTYKASDIFDVINQEQIFLIAIKTSDNFDTTPKHTSSTIMYIDKNCPQAELDKLIDEIGKGYVCTDIQMINAEKENVNEYMKVFSPFILIMFIVSFFGILSMTMMMTFKSIDLYKVYYICGCTKKRSLIISFFYSVIYYLGAGALSIYVLGILKKEYSYFEHYFLFSNKCIGILSITYIIVICLSILIPFSIIRKININELLQKSDE